MKKSTLIGGLVITACAAATVGAIICMKKSQADEEIENELTPEEVCDLEISDTIAE